MAHLWWKILSALLVFTTLILGLKTPLAPGVASVAPDQLNYGATSVQIQGYNTHFKESESSLQVWLTNGEAIFCPYELVIVDDAHLRASFSVDEEIAEAFFDLHIDNGADGKLYFPNAFLQKGMTVSLEPTITENCLEPLASVEVVPFDFPNQSILNETIRNLLFHVPSWFAMIFIMIVSLVYSLKYLRDPSPYFDLAAANAAHVGLLFSAIGLATGSIWARFTWGAWWVSDPRLNGAALGVLVYLAYFILRSSINEREKAARLAAVYNIFAFTMMMLFVMVLPRLTDSLHPGVGGNPAFNQYDLDDNMRLVFYPAVIGWIGMAFWIFDIRWRMAKLDFKQIMQYDR